MTATTSHKIYPHISGIAAHDGESRGELAIAAILSPSPDYPDAGRIIVASPETSDAELAAMSMGSEAAVRVASTLLTAAADVDAAIDAAVPPVLIATGQEPRCEICCRPIVAGERILIFLEDERDGERTRVAAKQVPVHADRCPGEA